MSRTICVHFLPSLVSPDEMRGGVAVVIDVLRASTTIVHALAAGAELVIPFAEVDAARSCAAGLPQEGCVLGGERQGLRIDGFHFDNSPRAYLRETVGGKTVVFTTTNGTRALDTCRRADRVLIGSLVNRDAVARVLAEQQRPVHLVCAGTAGHITTEDCLCAGALADRVLELGTAWTLANDEAQLARVLFRSVADDPAKRYETLCTSRGGRNLCELGFQADIEAAAKLDSIELVPEYYADTNRIIASTPAVP